MNKTIKIIVGILIILIFLSFFKDFLIKVSVEKGMGLVTGLSLKIGSFRLGIARTLVGIRNLRLYNPKGFKDRIMLDMPEVYVDYNITPLLKGKAHISDMRINMKEFVVVKNEKGELNLDSLNVVQAQKEGKAPQQKTAEKSNAKAPDIQIDNLELKVGKVIYKDYSKGGTPQVREFNVNLDEKYKNITNPYTLVSLIVVKALANTTIASLTNFDLGGLQNTVSDTLATTQKALEETASKAKAVAEETAEKTKEAVKETTETLKETTKGLAESFKLPFGSKEE